LDNKEEIQGRIVKIPGKHGDISLVVPNRNPTTEELESLHRVIAETIKNNRQK
jgi:hypothetical protein